jgi:hypothetical protein
VPTAEATTWNIWKRERPPGSRWKVVATVAGEKAATRHQVEMMASNRSPGGSDWCCLKEGDRP